MSTENDQIRREECRRAVRGFLAERQAVALHPRVILRRLNEGHAADYEEEEIRAALTFLVSDGQAKQEHSPEGATLYYQATTKGVLAHERRGA